jgi:tetratricopeptide (TPR) repeat protein
MEIFSGVLQKYEALQAVGSRRQLSDEMSAEAVSAAAGTKRVRVGRGIKKSNVSSRKIFMAKNSKQEDLTKVITEMEQKCSDKPGSVMAHHNLGLVYRKAGRLAEAVAALEKAIELDPFSVESLINLGALYFDMGDVDKAQAVNEQALNINQASAQAHANLGLIWQSQGDAARALEYYTNAVRHDPKLVTVWINMTSVHLMLRNDDKALAAAREAVKLEPDFPMAQNNLAVAFYYNGDYEAAKKHADRAIVLGYGVDQRFLDALNAELS